MNSHSGRQFQSLDAVMTALTVAGIATAFAMVIVLSGAHSVIA